MPVQAAVSSGGLAAIATFKSVIGVTKPLSRLAELSQFTTVQPFSHPRKISEIKKSRERKNFSRHRQT
jgi:hypothetical protein